MVFVDRLDLAVARAMQFGRALRPDELRAVHFVIDEHHGRTPRRRLARPRSRNARPRAHRLPRSPAHARRGRGRRARAERAATPRCACCCPSACSTACGTASCTTRPRSRWRARSRDFRTPTSPPCRSTSTSTTTTVSDDHTSTNGDGRRTAHGNGERKATLDDQLAACRSPRPRRVRRRSATCAGDSTSRCTDACRRCGSSRLSGSPSLECTLVGRHRQRVGRVLRTPPDRRRRDRRDRSPSKAWRSSIAAGSQS